MQLIEVSDLRTEKEFIKVNVDINKGDPNYIRPLDKDVNTVFDKEKNKAFRSGEVKRWVLKSDDGRLIGRIAAFANKKYRSKGDEQPTGGIGFFDCINDQEAADTLFNTARQWLIDKGFEAMDGPINFGERDRWWGLLVEGFIPPLYCMNYNQPYYQALFENYGFKVFFNQLCFSRGLKEPLPEKFFKGHERIAKDPAFHCEHVKKGRLEKYATDFATVYNKAWAGHDGNKQMEVKMAIKLFNSMRPVMDERLVWFAYKHEEPIAFYLNLPELNQFFKHFNGKFGLLQKLHFLWLKWTKGTKIFTGLVFGVVPEYHGTGVDHFMIVEAAKVLQHHTNYEKTELQWQGDFNPKIINITKNLEFSQTRRLVTYRYLFDRTKEFKRHPMLN